MKANTKEHYNLYVGIDIAARTASVAVLSPTEEKVSCFDIQQTSTDYKRLRELLEQSNLKPTQILIVLEPTGTYFLPLARYCFQAGYDVVVINPLTARHHFNATMKRDKTDRIDAVNLAEIAWLSRGHLELWKEPPLIYEELRQRLDLRDELVHFSVQQNNRRHAVEGRLAISAMNTHRNEVLDGLKKKIKTLEKEMKTILLQDEVWGETARYLFSIPGLGIYTVVSLITLTHNFSLVDSHEQLAAFIGVVPRKDESGEKKRQHISFSSAPNLRDALYIAVTSAIRFNPIIRSYHQREARKGKRGKRARIACMNKLLKMAWGCVQTKTMFDPAHHLPPKHSEATTN